MKLEETVEVVIKPTESKPICKICKGKLFENEINRKQKVCDCCVRKAMEFHGFIWKDFGGPHATGINSSKSS